MYLVFLKLGVQTLVVVPRDDKLQRGIDLTHEVQGRFCLLGRRPQRQVAAVKGDVGRWERPAEGARAADVAGVAGWVEQWVAWVSKKMRMRVWMDDEAISAWNEDFSSANQQKTILCSAS